jgi:hypothetical protein
VHVWYLTSVAYNLWYPVSINKAFTTLSRPHSTLYQSIINVPDILSHYHISTTSILVSGNRLSNYLIPDRAMLLSTNIGVLCFP